MTPAALQVLEPGQSLTYTITVTDGTGKAISGATVKVERRPAEDPSLILADHQRQRASDLHDYGSRRGADGAYDILFTASAGGVAGSASVTQENASVTRSVTVSRLPSVASISPSQGPTAGGTTVTITGTGLLDARLVRFGSVAGKIISDTATEIMVNAPAGKAGTVNVTVTTAGGTSHNSSADKFTYVAAPNIKVLDLALLDLMRQSSPSVAIRQKMAENIVPSAFV